jgi:hypothetical protein
MPYRSVYRTIEKRALEEGNSVFKLLELSDKCKEIAHARYEASRDAVEKYMAAEQLWKNLGCMLIDTSFCES